MFQGPSSFCRTPRLGSQCGAWAPHSWGRTFAIVIISFVSRLSDDVGLDYPSSPSLLSCSFFMSLGFPDGSVGKESACDAGDVGNVGLIPGLERPSREGHGNPLWYSCLENPMDRGAWWAAVHGIAKSQTRLKRLSTHTHISSPSLLSYCGSFFTSLFMENLFCYSTGCSHR